MHYEDFTSEPPERRPLDEEKLSTPIRDTDAIFCPICERIFDKATTTSMPFCSPRCRQIDLGRWLGESYGLPYEGEDRPEGFGVDDHDEED